MSKLKMALALVLVIALTVGATIAGTIAYMTSDDVDINVMTTGNVKIEQHEYERVLDEEGKPVLGVEGVDFKANYGITRSYKLQPFTQNKGVYPAFYNNAEDRVKYEEFQQLWNQVGAPGSNEIFDDSVSNVIDKFVFVENTGSVDCFFRTLVALERPDTVSGKLIHLNVTTNDRYDAPLSNAVGRIEIDGVQYDLFNYTYNQVLTPGEIARPSLLQVYLDPAATNEDCAAFGDTWEILVLSQAVQANGAADYETALNKAFGAVNVNNATEWFGGQLKEPFAVVTTLGKNDTLTNADGDAIVLDKGLMIDTTDSKMGLDLGKFPLDVAYQFEPYMSAEDGKKSEYADWHADFVVKVNKDIPAFGVGLAGYYDAWCSLNSDKWVLLASDGAIKAGEEIRLVKTMSDMMNMGITVAYKDLCEYGNDGIGFLCGAVALEGQNIDGNTVEEIEPGTTLTVELRLYEATDSSESSETGNYITTGVYEYTFE